MKREAWEAMNSTIARHNNKSSHQVISNDIVDALHEAGFVIVPHKITNDMLFDAGTMEGFNSFECDDNSDEYHSDWYETALMGCIKNRQESEQ